MLFRRGRLGRRIVWMLGLLLMLPLSWIGWNQANYNFAVLQAGRIYRSGQMSATALGRTLRDYKVKTVLNLRGPNPKEGWYRQERETALAAGATEIDVAMSSCLGMSRVQLRTLIGILDSCEYPLLIHCAWGSERTGLVSAFAELLRPGGTLAEARAQLSLWYLYVRLGDGKIMAEHLDQYESWLKAQHQEHKPETFRRWVEDGFEPIKPHRGQWPYDPYPLVVITRPEPRAQSMAAGDKPERR